MFIQESFDVTQVRIQDDQCLDGVTVIKAKRAEYAQWYFVFYQGDDPRLIVPKSCVKVTKKLASEVKVRLNVDTNLETTVSLIDIYFENSSLANNFYRFFTKST